MNGSVIALDQGTTSSRAVVIDGQGNLLGSGQYALAQHYPKPGWVECDPMEILQTQFQALADAFAGSGLSPRDVAAVGITNQRETVVIWEKGTGRPVCPAVSWQCRRTAELCDRMKADGLSDYVGQKTGLLVDAYFSGTKIKWMLDHVPGLRLRAERGDLLCGTVDSWLIWNLTGGVHATDCSNASRTMLFDIHRLAWDEQLCRYLGVPVHLLPQPLPSNGNFGRIAGGLRGLEHLAGIPVRGAIGDQQAALFGHACFAPGQAKNTYGTGCFTLLNTGTRPVCSAGGLLASVGWVIGDEPVYVLEGSVFNAGSAIQWLRDGLGLISTARECDILAERAKDNGGVYFVPAFTGLGAPYWDMYARGTMTGLTRGSTREHFARAVLESIAYQVADLVFLMKQSAGISLQELRVDGGASVSDVLLQFQADLLRIPVVRPQTVETTAMGAVYLAGLASGLWRDLEEIAALRGREDVFRPVMEENRSRRQYTGWRRAVERARNWEEPSGTEED